nr:MAG TPA: hypothetical protein [Crassvirales sp.]
MTGKIKRRSLRCGGRPKADFGSLFTSVIAPTLNAAGSIADSAIDKHKTLTSGIVNNNTTIPSDPTKTPTMRLGGRKKCWIGAAIGAATSIAGSLFGNGAKKREMRRQQSIRDWQTTTQEAANMTSVLNNSRDYQEDYLRQFRTAARLGKRLGAKGIYITDGGDATKIGNNTYLLRGGSHEDVNETGQTGIGINVGGNEIEAEGGEVAQKKNGALRIFSAQPILANGMSPAQAVISGASKDKVFNAQQRFKSRHHLSDDGGKAKHGTEVPYKRIHINEDGTFTDTLTGKNYNTSATNGEDVVITGKANHWKEAGKKDTSSYFDPMGAVNFATAVGAPILNVNPSNVVGSIRDSKNFKDFVRHYMMQDTGGFVNTEWAKEHPYLSLGINTIGDIGLGYGLGKTGVGLYRLRPSNLRKHIFENISPIGYDKAIPRIKAAFKSALSGAEADIDNPSWFNDKSAQDLNTYNVGITKSMFGPHALEARFDAWRKYLGLPQKFNTWTESPIVKGAYTDTKGISNLKVLPKEQSVDFINSAGGNVANNIEEFTTRGYNGQKYGISHIRDTWDLQPWSRLRGNIIEDKVIRPLYNATIGKTNRKLSSGLHKFINKYGYDNEAIQKYLNENGEEALNNLSDVIEYFADTKSIKGKLAHKLSGLDDVLNDKAYYTINKDSKLSKLTNKLSNKIKNFEASSLLPGAKPFNIAYDIPWTNEVFPNNEMVKGFNMVNTLPTEAYRYKLKNPLLDYTYRLGGRCKLRNGGLTSKDRGSSKHPYPSVSSKDFAGGGRSYPIPTKADAVDALRLAGLHGRSDVKAKVYSRYPELRKKARNGTWVKPVYNTSKYRGTIRARRQIAKWEGSDFAGQNAQFKGDAIGAKERELRQFMGKAYNYLNDNQRDALLSYYYNLVPKTFRGQMTKYRNALINAQTEQEYNDTLNNMRESINVGANRKGMRGLRNRRATERNWFGYNYANPIQEKVDKTLTQVPDATKVVQPIMQQSVITKPIEINSQEGYVLNNNPQGYNIPQGRLYDFIKSNMKRQLRYGGYSRPVKAIRPKAELGWLGYPYPLPRKWDFTNINLGNYKPSILSKNYPYAPGMDNKASQLENSDNYRDFSLYRTQLDETNPYVQVLTKATGHSWNDIKDNNYKLRYDHKLGYNHFTPEVKEDKYGIWGEPIEQKIWLDNDNTEIKGLYNPQKVINSSVNTKNTIPVDTKKTTEYDIRDNKFGMIPSTGDWVGLGIDTLTGLAGGIINYNAAKDIYIPGRAPIMLASKLPTNYNITPQLEEVKRYRNRLTGQTYNNTSSSVAALNRAGNVNLNSLNELSKLWTTKENKDNEMLTQDALNQQSVAETNIRNQMARENEIAQYKNAQHQAKYDAINASLTGLAQAYNNFYTNATKRYEDEIAMRTYLAGSEAATPYRMLSMGVPMSTRSRIGLLNQVGSITNPGPRPERKDYDSNASWSRAIDKWEKDNTLYKQRGQYKNMILRGINSKTKRKYGIG